MSGYYKDFRAEDVADPLYVRTLVAEGDGNIVAVIGVDACDLQDIHDAVTERITKYTGIAASNILISANHTHRGIPINDNPEIECYADAAFKDVVIRLIADTVILGVKRLKDVTAEFSKGYIDDISFNRNYIMEDGTLLTNGFRHPGKSKPLYGIDPEISVMMFKDSVGAPMGAVISFACHNDLMPLLHYSGGFVSTLSKELKNIYGNDFITVYLPGTSGDINHIDPKMDIMPDDWHQFMGKRLADEIVKAAKNAEPVCGDDIKAYKETITLNKRKYTNESIRKDIQGFLDLKDTRSIRNLLTYTTVNKSDTEDVYIQCIKIGDVNFYAYPGEIFVNFGLELKKKSPTDKNIIATLANGYCGYVPTRECFGKKSKLYETSLGPCVYLDAEAGYVMNDKLIELANKHK